MEAYRRTLLKQLIPFLVIGVGCALVDFGITSILTHHSPLGRLLSKAIGWGVGTLIAYVLNSRFAFQSKLDFKHASAVFILYGATLGVQLFFYQITDAPLQKLGFVDPWKDAVSFIIAQGVATVTNFLLQRHLIFREQTKIIYEEAPRKY